MLYQLVHETPMGELVISTGTHRQMWETLRQQPSEQQNTLFVCAVPELPLILGGDRDTPKGLRSTGLFPGVKRTVRKSYNRTTRQCVRKQLNQFTQKAGCECAIYS